MKNKLPPNKIGDGFGSDPSPNVIIRDGSEVGSVSKCHIGDGSEVGSVSK